MGAVFFYHLTRRPLEVTLPMLLDKSLQAGWRVYVRGPDLDQLAKLDEALWLGGGDAAFLPHGLAGGAHDADQPILLGADKPSNGATCLMSIGGAELSVDEVNQAERCCILFDGNNESAVAHARVQWKVMVDANCSAQYWAEADGNWQKMAES